MPLLGRQHPGGIFARVLDWMLTPLLVVWPLVILGTWFTATAVAEATFDRSLRDMTRAVAEEARHAVGGPLPVLESLRNDPIDRFYAQITREDGTPVTGDRAIPMPAEGDTEDVTIRDGRIGGEPARIASTVRTGLDGVVYRVQVGDPLLRRRALVREVTIIVMGVLLVIVPVSVALALFGVWRGLRPVRTLREHIESRPPGDLSPIPVEAAPAELKPMVASLNRQLERVARSLESQKRFVADAAHQMKTPLAGLRVLAEAARRGSSLEEARSRLARIEESADRMSRVVAQMLALARADEAGATGPPREPVDLNALLRDVCESAADRAIAHGVSLGFDATSPAAVVPGSPLLLRELFANLLDNAIRYTPTGGEVAVRVTGGPPARVTVDDSGPGIPEAERELVFERFHRVLGTGQSGSGLGLSVVRAIADLHGAKVALEDGPGGRGTRAVVAF